MNEIKEIAKSLDKEKAVSLFNLLKEGKYFAFLKEVLKLLWKGYGKYIKPSDHVRGLMFYSY